MEAIIKILSSDFNEDLFIKIKKLLKGRNAEITIAVKETEHSTSLSETKDEFWRRLSKSIKDIRQGKGKTFTMQELDEFIKQ